MSDLTLAMVNPPDGNRGIFKFSLQSPQRKLGDY